MNTQPKTKSQELRTVSGLRSLVYRPQTLLREAASTIAKSMADKSVSRPQSTVYGLRSASAFTLIELLVVIVVIAILMGVTLPVSKYAIGRAKAARQEVMLAKIRSALDDYRATYGEYPITPDANRPPINYPDAVRHYRDNYPTECNYTTNSPYTNIYLTSSGTVEKVAGLQVDYGLTYPLMLKQLEKGARPFYVFPEVTVVSLVYRRWGAVDASGHREDEWKMTIYRKGGGIKDLLGLRGAPVNRPKAIDPVSGCQWKYECYDGTTYTITTNIFQ